jgi:hypothetical protein
MNGNFHMIVEQPWDGVFFPHFETRSNDRNGVTEGELDAPLGP